MGVLREISRLPDALHRLTSAIQAELPSFKSLALELAKSRPADDRIEALEQSRAMHEAEMEAWFLKAESKYKAAAAAESRARKQNEKQFDHFTENSEPVEEGIPPEYAEVGTPEGVRNVRMDVAPPSKKELAKRMKFMS